MPDTIDDLMEAESRAEALAPKPKGIDPEDKRLLESGCMSRNAARELTEQIRSMATATYVLVKRAYDHKAWVAMGYGSWGEYVSKEFSISRSRSYQLINQANVIEAITESAPDGTAITITEAQARDVEKALPKITSRVRRETAGQDPKEAEGTVRDIIDDTRNEVKAARKAKDAKADDDPWETAVREAAKAKAAMPDAQVEGPRPDTDGVDSAAMDTRGRRPSAKPDKIREPRESKVTMGDDFGDESTSGFDGGGGGNVGMSAVVVDYIFSYFKELTLTSADEVAESVNDPEGMIKSADNAIEWLTAFRDTLSKRP